MPTDPKLPVTVVIPTLDEAGSIGDCLRSVEWASEAIVVDGGSGDATVTVAASLGARVLVATDTTIGGQRNRGIEAATNGWILALDADERAAPSLRIQVATAIGAGREVVYSFRRRNRFLGREMRWGGWGNDRVPRLFPQSARFDDRRVHERLRCSGPVEPLPGVIEHEPYRNLAEYRSKLRRYADWAAPGLVGRGRVRLGIAAWLRPALRVARMLVVQLGVLDGSAGVRLALLSGLAVREKYRRACELARRR